MVISLFFDPFVLCLVRATEDFWKKKKKNWELDPFPGIRVRQGWSFKVDYLCEKKEKRSFLMHAVMMQKNIIVFMTIDHQTCLIYLFLLTLFCWQILSEEKSMTLKDKKKKDLTVGDFCFCFFSCNGYPGNYFYCLTILLDDYVISAVKYFLLCCSYYSDTYIWLAFACFWCAECVK